MREGAPLAGSACERLVYLQAGLVVPVEAYDLALMCEARGIVLRPRGDALDVDGPHSPAILEALRRNKAHVLAILRYTADDRHLFDQSLAFPEHGPITSLGAMERLKNNQ